MNPDRVNTWDENRKVDRLFGKEGGMVIWLRRGEVGARAAVRGGHDTVQAVIDVASIQIAYERLLESVATQHKIPLDDFKGMVDVARKQVLDRRTDHVTRIMTKGPSC